MTDYIKREDAIQDIDNAHANTITQRGYKDYWSADLETQLVCDGLAKAIEAIFDTLSADVVEADKAQKEIDYWHDKAQSYEQTILKLSLNKADIVEVVRCKDCKYAEVADPEDSQDGYICQFHRGCIWFSGSYCSWGERAEA